MGRPGDGSREREPIPEAEAERWRDALRAALSGPSVRRSARSRELLNYLVDETIAGRRDRITGTTIAQDVLGRDASFDGDGDAIVRVQMRRLRVQLAQDATAEELGAAPRIVVPKGAYRPELHDPPRGGAAPPQDEAAPGFAEAPAPPPTPPTRRTEMSAEATPHRGRDRLLLAAASMLLLAVLALTAVEVAGLLTRDPEAAAPLTAREAPPRAARAGAPPAPIDWPSVAVLPFRNLTGDPSNDVFQTGLQLQVASDLQRFGTVKAFALDAPEMRGGQVPARYYIGGTVLEIAGEMDVFVFLTDAETGRSALSRRIREPRADTGEPGDYYTVLTRLSRAVSGHMAGHYGGIETAEQIRMVAEAGLDDERGMEGFRCIALSQVFRRTRTLEDHRRAMSCLDAHLKTHPEDGLVTAHKALVAFHSLPEMGLMDTRSLDWSTTAGEVLALARRAVSLAPGSDAAHAIRGTILSSFGDAREAIASLRRAADLNPGNPTIHGLLALALMGEDRWEEAARVADRAVAISAEPEPFFYLPAFLVALAEDDIGTALATASEVARTRAPWAPTIELVAADLAGKGGELRALRREVRAYAEAHGGDALAGLRRWVPSERGMAELEARLKAAGL